MDAVRSRIATTIRLVEEMGQRLRVNISPAHFYSETPSFAELRRETYWRAPMSMVGVRGADTGAQMEFVRGCCRGLRAEAADPSVYDRAVAQNGEVGYGPIEASMLYCFVRSRRPRKIVQVGCGVSTVVIQRAAGDAGYEPELVCVEPFPTEFLLGEGRAGRLRLVAQKAQVVPLETLTGLGAGDLLFVDSTHTVKVGSEVVRIVLEVLPRIAEGVFVHFHDITFPFDYAPGVLGSDIFMWRESTLLHAFLAMNAGYTIRASLSMLHHERGKELREVFPQYRPAVHRDAVVVREGHFPSATYLERCPA